MRNSSSWTPTKFVLVKGRITSSRDTKFVARGSRLVAAIQAREYGAIIRAHARGRLLDLGCGNVPLFDAYKHRVSSVTCVDWQNSLHSISHVDIVADMNGPLPLKPCSFDTIILTDVLEHIYEPRSLIREVANALDRGGKLLLGVPFTYWIHEEPFDYFRYTEYALRRMCLEVGMHVLQLAPYGGAPEVVFDILEKSFQRWRLVSEMINRAGSFALSRPSANRVSARSAMRIPLGYTLVAQKG